MSDMIKLCPKCKLPVVFTMAMPFKEYGCVECNIWGEFLGSGFPKVEATPKLLKIQKEREKKWRKDLTFIASRRGRAMCAKLYKPLKDCRCKDHKFLENYKPQFIGVRLK